MDSTALIILAVAFVTAFLLFGMIFYGTRKQFHALQKELGASAMDIKGSAGDLVRALEKSQRQQEQVLSRLENLETIVTSEAWDALQAGEAEGRIALLLDDEVPEEPTTAEKARDLARRVR